MKDAKRTPRRQADQPEQTSEREKTEVTEQEKSTRVVQRVEPAENPISEETGEYLDR